MRSREPAADKRRHRVRRRMMPYWLADLDDGLIVPLVARQAGRAENLRPLAARRFGSELGFQALDGAKQHAPPPSNGGKVHEEQPKQAARP